MIGLAACPDTYPGMSVSTVGNTFGHPKGACPRGVADCTGCNPNSGPAAEADASALGLLATPEEEASARLAEALALVEADGEGPLDESDHQYLAVLVDPEALSDNGFAFYGVAQSLEEWEDFGGTYGPEIYECSGLADLLRARYDRLEGHPDFAFGLDASPDGEVGTYSVGTYLGPEVNAYFQAHHDIKHLGRTSRTGVRGAVDTLRSLDQDYQEVLSKARRAGVVEDDLTKKSDEEIAASFAQAAAMHDALSDAYGGAGPEHPLYREYGVAKSRLNTVHAEYRRRGLARS